MIGIITLAGALTANATNTPTAPTHNQTVLPTDKSPQQVIIKIPQQEFSSSGHTNYVITLLRLALARSKSPNEEIVLQSIPETFTQARLIAELQRGLSVDVIWTMTSKEREDAMQPIRVPLLKGLLGKRVFLIRAGQQDVFSRITSLQQLAQLTAGQGAHWPDTDILRANGLRVHTSIQYELLFSMLRGGRFDYFPRGVNEAWIELEAHKDEGLAVEETLMLSYPAPMYFFVQHGNAALAQRLEQGLELMIQDGSFDALFESHPSLMHFLKRANMKNRRVFKLANPGLPEETPLQEARYWLGD